MAEIILSSTGRAGINIDNTTILKHNKLKNLDFEESGHTGFQKELSAKQLEAIENIKAKEDKANKIRFIDDVRNDEQYLSAAGTLELVVQKEESVKTYTDEQYKSLDERVTTNEESIASAFHHIQLHEQQIADLSTCGDFELVDSAELTEDVVNVTPTIEQNYKELYMVFTIPTVNSDGSNTDKCRIRGYVNDNRDFLIQGAAYVENYKEEWKLFIHAKFIANYIKADIFHITSKTNKMGYIVAPSSNTQNGVVQPGFEMNEDYFNNLTIKMFDANGKQILRCFPVGTKYKLWGVKK